MLENQVIDKPVAAELASFRLPADTTALPVCLRVAEIDTRGFFPFFFFGSQLVHQPRQMIAIPRLRIVKNGYRGFELFMELSIFWATCI